MNELIRKHKLDVRHANKSVKWGPWAAALVSAAAYLVPIILLGVLVALVASIRGANEPEQIIDSSNYLQVLLLSIFVSLSAVAIIFRYVANKGGLKALGFDKLKKKYLVQALKAYGVYFVVFFSALFVVTLIDSGITEQPQDLGFEDPSGILNMLYVFFLLVVIPPIYEEILFRGFFFQGVAKVFGFLPAAISVSGLFALAHQQLNVGIDTFILGVIASWLVWKTKSIWPAIALHAIKNLTAYIFRFVLS